MDRLRWPGFTLVELLVVILIAALVAAVAPPLLSRGLPGVEAKGAARNLASGLRQARGHAIAMREETALSIDLEARSFQIQGHDRKQQLPRDLSLTLVTARTEVAAERIGFIRFFPDGSSTGGRITVKKGTHEYDVDVDWLTGRVVILE